MTKTFKTYLIIWTICFVIFNTLIFVSPARINVVSGNFWIGYVFMVLAFIGQLVCSYIAFKDQNIKKMFYNTSLLLISYICFIASIIVGTICVIFPILPISIGTTMCVLISGIFAILVIITCSAINVVSNIDNEVQTKTFVIKLLTADAEHLWSVANSNEMKKICETVYESLRYSNAMSNKALTEINEQIQSQFKSFENAVNSEDKELADNIAKELISLIDKRNKQCKLLK